MKLVHSLSLYDEKEGKDVIISRGSRKLIKGFTTTEDIKSVIDSELNNDFMTKVAEIYLNYGIDTAKAYSNYKYGSKELTKEEIELLESARLA